uniref:Uncharacterized protein n=1 Tax=Ignisphaera aggregans TaxID=334771 RepID=A0A7C5YZ99_9CREN
MEINNPNISNISKSSRKEVKKEFKLLKIFHGGQSVGTLPLTIQVLDKYGMRIDSDGVIDVGNALGKIAVADGDYTVVTWAKNEMSVPAYHVYYPAGRRARQAYENIVNKIKSEAQDVELQQLFNDLRIGEWSLVVLQCAISGIGYVQVRRVIENYKPVKDRVGAARVAIMPSIYEKGVEDSIKFFLEEEPKSNTYAKTIVIHSDIASLVIEYLKRPALAEHIIKKKADIKSPNDIKKICGRLDFRNVDYLLQIFDIVLFVGLLQRNLKLPGKDNVKSIDPWDFYNAIPSDFTALSFVKLSRGVELHDAVFAGLTTLVPEDSLKDYVVISPSDDVIPDDKEYPPSAVFVLKELDDIAVVLVAIDRSRFREFWEKMLM